MKSEPVNTFAESHEPAGPALQRCVEPGCRATYGLNERVYVCRRCGGLLDIEKPFAVENAFARSSIAAELRAISQARLASSDPIEPSGVLRYRELLAVAD